MLAPTLAATPALTEASRSIEMLGSATEGMAIPGAVMEGNTNDGVTLEAVADVNRAVV